MPNCLCGGELVATTILALPSHNNKNVTLYNVPVEECLVCGGWQFSLDDRVSSAFVYAQINGISDYDFNDWKKILFEMKGDDWNMDWFTGGHFGLGERGDERVSI